MQICGIVERILQKRGISGRDLECYLDPSLKRLADAFSFPGIREAADCIICAVRKKRRIVVFGDYDCDGVCASAILVTTLRRFGADVAMFVPDRFTEGYGMTSASVVRMLNENPDVSLVVTVDCGITSAAEVAFLKDRGVSVVVTDHHLPPPELPACDALVDPKVPSQIAAAETLGVKDLSGAGIAFFLANVLAARATEEGLYGGGKFGGPLLVLAGLASVVDIVPLLGQNRILVANALKTFRSLAPVGLKELLNRAQRRAEDVTSRDFGFLLGPRINAAGRIASARDAYDLLMAEDRELARRLAFEVNGHNDERRRIEQEMLKEASSLMSAESSDAVVVNLDGADSGADFDRYAGVCGIVASRILEKRGVPVAIAVNGHGSVRSPEGCDAHAALVACGRFLERFGGHTAAAGFTVKDGLFDDFSAAFKSICAKQLSSAGSCGKDAIAEPEMWISPGDLTMELYEAVSAMEPFGEGNPEPVFGLRGIMFSDVRLLGGDARHVLFSIAGHRMPRATWWNQADKAEGIRAKASMLFDITFTLDVSDWGGTGPRLELRIKDVGLSQR